MGRILESQKYSFYPIIDLEPTNETCIYSTLLFIRQQAQSLNITTPCITFDQPLWLKATEIISTKSLGIVCRLRGFHLLMSFLGSISKMMEFSGGNTVIHIISGKAIS